MHFSILKTDVFQPLLPAYLLDNNDWWSTFLRLPGQFSDSRPSAVYPGPDSQDQPPRNGHNDHDVVQAHVPHVHQIHRQDLVSYP